MSNVFNDDQVKAMIKELDGPRLKLLGEELSEDAIRSLAATLSSKRDQKILAVVAKSVIKEKVVEALSVSPFVYESDDIEIMPGTVVKFTTMIKAQEQNVHDTLSGMRDEIDTENKLADTYGMLVLSQSLSKYRGEDFGGVVLDFDAVTTTLATSGEDGRKMISEAGKARMSAIDAMPVTVVNVLLLNLRAFHSEVERHCFGDEAGEILGN